jgi:hypothetical protein
LRDEVVAGLTPETKLASLLLYLSVEKIIEEPSLVSAIAFSLISHLAFSAYPKPEELP